MICEMLDILALRRDVSSLCVLYRIYHGECSEELKQQKHTAHHSRTHPKVNGMYKLTNLSSRVYALILY